MSQLINTTPRSEIKYTQNLHNYFQQLEILLKRRTGDERCADLFARPVKDMSKDAVSWYTELEGKIQRLSELDEAEQDELLALYSELDQKIQHVIAELDASGQKDQKRNAELLKDMCNYPGSADFFFKVGDQIVITGWGVSSPANKPIREIISSSISQPEAREATTGIVTNTVSNNTTETEERSLLDKEIETVIQTGQTEVINTQQASEQIVTTNKRSFLGWLWWFLSFALLLIIILLMLTRCSSDELSFLDFTDEDDKSLEEHNESDSPEQFETLQEPKFYTQDDSTDSNDELLFLRNKNRLLKADINTINEKIQQQTLLCLDGGCDEITSSQPENKPILEPPVVPPVEPPVESPDETVDSEIDRTIKQTLEKKGVDLNEMDISVSLVWKAYHDLDLMVKTPDNTTIYFKHKSDRRGGRLNHDAQRSARNVTRGIVFENITWPKGKAPAGRYQVSVLLYRFDFRQFNINPIKFIIKRKANGKVKVINKQVSLLQLKQPILIDEFVVQ